MVNKAYEDGPLSDYSVNDEAYREVVALRRTDKGVHGYVPVYDELARTVGQSARVCELGVLGGASLMMWQEYFPRGLIVGVDNNENAYWPDSTIKILLNQEDPLLPERLTKISPQYDIIIDDCSHIGSLTAESFRLLWPLVSKAGFYVIEDWKCGDDTAMVQVARSFFEMLNEDNQRPFTFRSVEYVRGNQDNSAMVLVRKSL